MIYPSRDDYLIDIDQYDLIPVWEEFAVDLETPISIFKKAADGQYAFLLESVAGGEQLARYSFIGYDPFLIFKAKENMVEIKENRRKRTEIGEPLIKLRELISGLMVREIPDQPRFFGGAVGFLGYDLIRRHEQLPVLTVDDLELPDCYFIITRVVLIYDHVRHSLTVVVLIPCRDNPGSRGYDEAVTLIQQIKQRIRDELPDDNDFSCQEMIMISEREVPSIPAVSNMSSEKFIGNVKKIKEYIKAGDVFQVVLSQRFQLELQVDPFNVYRVLRCVNPSPYMYYLNFQDVQLVGSSPEMLVRVENGWAQTHPIAGTRPRGLDQEADQRFAQELIADPKELAEHLMLVDLGRNDLGRVCEYGTVNVTKLMEIDRYSHVMHLVSTVQGKLSSAKDAFDALMACFPAGTVTGAPKIRAMEIIEELELTRRGPYAGAVGYLSFNGNLDSCITIRTIVMKNGLAYVQAGAGIVADSDPEKEQEEILNKAKALLGALKLAERG